MGAEGKGVTAKWGLEEAGGEPHGRRNTKRTGGARPRVSRRNTTKPWLPRGGGVDLEKLFDRVNRDRLPAPVARKVDDKRVLGLIRPYLESRVMVNGVVVETAEGTPQGGPLSPLLSNVYLEELDKELERRGHNFCR